MIKKKKIEESFEKDNGGNVQKVHSRTECIFGTERFLQ